MNAPTIAIDMMPVYRIRAQGEHATICVQAQIRYEVGTSKERYSGEMLVHSGWGSFGYFWPACGRPFLEFLIRLDRDYLMEKLFGEDYYVFDAEATAERFRETMRAANPFADLSDFDESVRSTMDQASFLAAIAECDGLPEVLTGEPWNFFERKPNPQAIGFWEQIWPVFVGQLRKEGVV